MIWNGVICNALPYLTWALALDLGNTAVIANLAYLTPFVSLLCTHFVLGEKITVFSVLGLVLIVTGIAIQMLVNKKIGKNSCRARILRCISYNHASMNRFLIFFL